MKGLKLYGLDRVTSVKTALRYYSLVKGLTSGSRVHAITEILLGLNTLSRSCELIEDTPEKLLGL